MTRRSRLAIGSADDSDVRRRKFAQRFSVPVARKRFQAFAGRAPILCDEN